jgi:hypothetical protein
MHKKLRSDCFHSVLVASQDHHPICVLMTSGLAYDNHTTDKTVKVPTDGVTNPS